MSEKNVLVTHTAEFHFPHFFLRMINVNPDNALDVTPHLILHLIQQVKSYQKNDYQLRKSRQGLLVPVQ